MTYTIGDMVSNALSRQEKKEDERFIEFVQGDIWLANLEKKAMGHEQGGRRPVLIISKTEWNVKSKTPICVICTTSVKKGKNRYTVDLRRENSDIDKHTYANGSQLYTLDSARFIRKVDSVSKDKLLAVKKVLTSLTWID